MSQFRIRLLDQMSRLAEETGSAVVLVGGERRLPWNQDYHVTIYYDKSYYYYYNQIIKMNVTGHINFPLLKSPALPELINPLLPLDFPAS